jgi:serine/threonine protein kinase
LCLRLRGYTLGDVLRWTRHLATALYCLASLEPEPVVHGDVKPNNILVEDSTGNLVLGDYGTGMWQGLKTGLRLAPWLLSAGAYVAPERRLTILGPDSALSDAMKDEALTELMRKVGGGKLDMWSLGVVVYLLGVRKNPHGYEEEAEKMNEVDALAKREDAKQWLRTELRGVWPEGKDGDLKLVAKVISGTLQGLDRRLSAKEVLQLLGPIGEKHARALMLRGQQECRRWVGGLT